MVTETRGPIAFEDFFAALDHVETLRAKHETSLLTARGATPAKALGAASLPNIEPHKLMNESDWVAFRDSGIKPLEVTELVTTEATRREFLTGAALLRKLATLTPQMLLVADMLNAGIPFNAILEPRRAGKTTGVLVVAVGRVACRDDYRVGFTVTTSQKKTSDRFRLDVMNEMARAYPNEERRPFKLSWSNGGERVEFRSRGSYIAALTPIGDAFRSDAYDMALVDEGGEADMAQGGDLMGGILPTFDTKHGAQLVTAGTAADFRDGNMLWDELHRPESGKLRYSAPDDIPDEQLADWEPSDEYPDARVREIVLETHPGIGNLTTLDKIKANWDRWQDPRRFAREYLGVFGEIGTSKGLLDMAKWHACGHGAEPPKPPERFALAMATHPDQTRASIVAAWREKGRAQILLIDNRAGVKWLAAAALKYARSYSVPIVYDSGSPSVLNTVEALSRARPKPPLNAQGFMAVKKAAALLVDEVERQNVDHWKQPDLDAAAQAVVKRKAGMNGWALGRDPKRPEDDITPLEAAALALLIYDESRPRSRARAQVRS